MREKSSGLERLPDLRLFREALWGVVDQALSSVTNFLVVFLAARTLSVVDFGHFTLAFSAYLLALGVSRALTTEPFAIWLGAARGSRWRPDVRSVVGVALTVGVIGGGVTAAAGGFLQGDGGRALAAIGIFLPGLLLQDAWRGVFFAQGRGSAAALNDLIWALALCPLLPWALAARDLGVFASVWGVSGMVAAVAGVLQARVLPSVGGIRPWWRMQRALATCFLGEFLVLVGAAQGVLYVLAAISGAADVAALRAAQLLFGPLNVPMIGIRTAVLPQAAKVANRRPTQLMSICGGVAGTLLAASILWGGVLMQIPADVGRELLKANWAPARALVLPVMLAVAGQGVTVGAAIGIRARGDAARSLRVRAASAVMLVAAAFVGARANGVAGAAWGVAGAGWVGVVMWWWQLGASVLGLGNRRLAPLGERL